MLLPRVMTGNVHKAVVKACFTFRNATLASIILLFSSPCLSIFVFRPRVQRKSYNRCTSLLRFRKGVRSPSAHLGLCSFDVASRACSLARAAPSDPLFTYTKKAVKKDEVRRFDFLTDPLAREMLEDGARHVSAEDAMLLF